MVYLWLKNSTFGGGRNKTVISTNYLFLNWSTSSYIHNVKRNRLNATRAGKLVFIHSDIRLLSHLTKSYKEGPCGIWNIDLEEIDIDDFVIRLQEKRLKLLHGDYIHDI